MIGLLCGSVFLLRSESLLPPAAPGRASAVPTDPSPPDGVAPDAGCMLCDPALCGSAAPPMCLTPPPSPCVDPVASLGCDGLWYGTDCDRVAAGVCANACPTVHYSVVGQTLRCGPLSESCGPWVGDTNATVYREQSCFESGLGACLSPLPVVDFATSEVVAVCFGCGCAGRVELEQVRDCGGRIVVDYDYSNPCTECDACITMCVVLTIPTSTTPVAGNFHDRPCSGGCCPP